MVRRKVRRRSVMWRALCKQSTSIGRMAAVVEGHKFAALANMQMAPVPASDVQCAQEIGKKIFFTIIDAGPFVLNKIAPGQMQRWKQKSTAKRRRKIGVSSQKRHLRHMANLSVKTAAR